MKYDYSKMQAFMAAPVCSSDDGSYCDCFNDCDGGE